MVGDAIAMTDEDVLTVKTIYGTMTCSLKLFFVTFEEEISTTIPHVDTLTVEIGAINRLAATYGHTVVTLATLATVVPGYKEIIPAIVLEDKGCLDGIGACIIGGRVLRRIDLRSSLLTLSRIQAYLILLSLNRSLWINRKSCLGILAIQIITASNSARSY